MLMLRCTAATRHNGRCWRLIGWYLSEIRTIIIIIYWTFQKLSKDCFFKIRNFFPFKIQCFFIQNLNCFYSELSIIYIIFQFFLLNQVFFLDWSGKFKSFANWNIPIFKVRIPNGTVFRCMSADTGGVIGTSL